MSNSVPEILGGITENIDKNESNINNLNREKKEVEEIQENNGEDNQ